MKRDPTITLAPYLSADAPNQHSPCARDGITFRRGYRYQTGLPVSRDMECGSMAAAAAVLTIWHELQRPPLPVHDPGDGEASTRAGIPPQIELHRCIADNLAQRLSIDSRSDKAQDWSRFWYKETFPPTVAPPPGHKQNKVAQALA